MNLLIDTNVISEMTKPRPDPRVVAFLHETDEDRLFLSVVTLAELTHGVAMKSDGKAKRVLATWLANDLAERFSGRVLDIDPPIANAWGDLMASAQRYGLALHVMDGFLAATAMTRGLTLATRNVKDFVPLGVPVFDPWNS
jgi:predicted nucleic acid-binding protein